MAAGGTARPDPFAGGQAQCLEALRTPPVLKSARQTPCLSPQ